MHSMNQIILSRAQADIIITLYLKKQICCQDMCAKTDFSAIYENFPLFCNLSEVPAFSG